MPDTAAGTRTARRGAVGIGGSTAGMLAASVLATRFHEVTVVEADRLPAGPEPRKGLPQARHAHLCCGPAGWTRWRARCPAPR